MCCFVECNFKGLIFRSSYILILLVIFTIQINAIFLISIPKTGSHLTQKVMNQVLKNSNIPFLKGDALLNLPKDIFQEKYFWYKDNDDYSYWIDGMGSAKQLDFFVNLNILTVSHLLYNKSNQDALLKNGKVLFNLRDPRDQAVSLTHWLRSFPESYPHAITMSFDEVLTDIIKGIDTYYNIWLPWMDYPYGLTVRFEDLVGSKGGGDDAKQLEAVKAIAKHISVELSEERAQEIATDLFGITKNTFRKGQIGAWKEEFTPEHKELFKRYGGELLIKLGYEKDLNW